MSQLCREPHSAVHTLSSSLSPDFPKPAPTTPISRPLGGLGRSHGAGAQQGIPGLARSPALRVRAAEGDRGLSAGRKEGGLQGFEGGNGEATERGGRAG